MTRLLAGALMLALAGCVPVVRGAVTTSSLRLAYTVSPLRGQSADQVKADQATCEATIVAVPLGERLLDVLTSLGPVGTGPSLLIAVRRYETCMTAKGYALQAKPVVPGGS